MKILLENPLGRHADNGKRDKKSHKILKKMAKLEKKLSKYNIEDANSDDASSSDSSEAGRFSRRRHCRRNRSRSGSRSSSDSSSSSSSSSSRSPSPQHHYHHHGYLSRSRSFGGHSNCSPIPISREDRRHHHQRRHHSSHHREFYGKPHHHHHHRYFRRCNNIVEGGRFRNLASSEPNLQDETSSTGARSQNREPELVDIEMDDNFQETVSNLENEADDVVTGPEIDEVLVHNWKEIVQNGLPDDKLQELMKKYPVSKKHHSLSLQGPKLNKEAVYVVSDAAVRKDTLNLNSQNGIGIGLSALGQAISSLTSKPDIGQEVVDVVEKLNDAATVLLDVHYNMTKQRQLNILLDVNKKAQAVLKTCKHDEFLFGKDLEEKAKHAKGFGKCKKMWKNKNAESRCEMIGKRKHVNQEREMRKSKRLDSSN